MPLIVENVNPGSKIYSDKFSSYVTKFSNSHLNPLGFDHYFVNHSLTFVDPINNDIHTNNIERTWRSLRASISHTKRSLPHDKILGFLDTFKFQNYFSKEALYDVLLQMLMCR